MATVANSVDICAIRRLDNATTCMQRVLGTYGKFWVVPCCRSNQAVDGVFVIMGGVESVGVKRGTTTGCIATGERRKWLWKKSANDIVSGICAITCCYGDWSWQRYCTHSEMRIAATKKQQPQHSKPQSDIEVAAFCELACSRSLTLGCA